MTNQTGKEVKWYANSIAKESIWPYEIRVVVADDYDAVANRLAELEAENKELESALCREELRFAEADQERIDLRKQLHVLTDDQAETIKELETAEAERDALKDKLAEAEKVLREILETPYYEETCRLIENFLSTLPEKESSASVDAACKGSQRILQESPSTGREGNSIREYYGLDGDCRSGGDGDCVWKHCPQLRDGEPKKSGRHCPLDNRHSDKEGEKG